MVLPLLSFRTSTWRRRHRGPGTLRRSHSCRPAFPVVRGCSPQQSLRPAGLPPDPLPPRYGACLLPHRGLRLRRRCCSLSVYAFPHTHAHTHTRACMHTHVRAHTLSLPNAPCSTSGPTFSHLGADGSQLPFSSLLLGRPWLRAPRTVALNRRRCSTRSVFAKSAEGAVDRNRMALRSVPPAEPATARTSSRYCRRQSLN